MGSKSSGSGGGGGGGGSKPKTTLPGTSGGFQSNVVSGTTNLKKATTPVSTGGGGGKAKTAAEIGKELDKLLAAGPAPAPTPKKVSEAMNKPMSPAQSKAMAGNTGLAGISEAQANTIIEANKQINQIFGDNRPETLQSLGQTFGEVGSKYQRPADKEKYAQEVSTIAEGLAAGATPFIGPDEIARIGFVGTGLKDEEGRTILSKQLPGVTAQAPTLGQLGGDIVRGVTGYNSLQYTDPTSNVPEMVFTPGLAQGLSKIAIPGSIALNMLQDLYAKGKGFLFPGEEEEEFQSLVPQPINIEELTTTPVSSTINQPSSPRAVGAESVGIDPITGLPTGEANVPEVIVVPPSTGGGGGGGTTAPVVEDTTPEETTAGLTDYQKLLQRYAELAGFDPTRTANLVRRYAANGGLMNLTQTVPPKRGPMSEGVASLFKNK